MANSRRFVCPPIVDPMGEVFSAQDFDCLGHNITRLVRKRVCTSRPLVVVELGTWSGQSTLAIAQPHVLVHCLSSWDYPGVEQWDQWLDTRGSEEGLPDTVGNLAFQRFLENTKGFAFRTVFPLICYAYDAADWWPERLDAIYINGDAGADVLRALVTRWSKHVRSGGWIYGRYRDHTVAGLTGLGHYTIDGTIWRHRVVKEYST